LAERSGHETKKVLGLARNLGEITFSDVPLILLSLFYHRHTMSMAEGEVSGVEPQISRIELEASRRWSNSHLMPNLPPLPSRPPKHFGRSPALPALRRQRCHRSLFPAHGPHLHVPHELSNAPASIDSISTAACV
jgi:hypothetical protein